MKHLWFISLIFLSQIIHHSQSNATEDLRSKIGSTFSAPVEYQQHYYFVATTGVLYESDLQFKKITKLYEGKKQTLGSVLLHHDSLYWGDGLHGDQTSVLHVFNLKTKKLSKTLDIKGHIERAPFGLNEQILIPAGPGGLLSLEETSLKILWQTQKFEGKSLHIDSNLVQDGNQVCATSVYEVKGVICLNSQTGKVEQFGSLKRDPKSEITISNHQIVGFATDADLVKNKWDIPADLFAYDLSLKKFTLNKELRGFNFFAPVIASGEAYVTLSTGDFITVSLKDGKIGFWGEFPEPFINSAFLKNDQFCGVGIMGKVLCYTKTKSGSAISFEKRLLETVIGRVSLIHDTIVMPSRTGFALQSLN
jgi:hypothetical protein